MPKQKLFSYYQHYLPVINIFSKVLFCLALAMLVPFLVSTWLHEQLYTQYVAGIGITAGTAMVLYVFSYRAKKELLTEHAIMLVCSIWVLLPFFAGILFYKVLHHQNVYLSVVQIYFEMVSSLTTTGSTIFTSLDNLPTSINLWRTFLQWLGGMGIVLLALAILPLIGISGRHLYRLESAGVFTQTTLTAKVSQTAKWLWIIYVFFSFFCACLYWLSGLDALEAIMLMFTTISLGGAPIHDLNFQQYSSVYTEVVAIVFMLLASCNFAMYFSVIKAGNLKAIKNNVEFKATLLTVILSAFFISLFLFLKGVYPSWSDALRYGGFNAVSIATTTGFTIDSYSDWPIFAPIFLILLSGIAASAGSTGGGIKMMRIILLLKQAQSELTKLLHPQSIRPVTLANKTVAARVIFSVTVFIFFYLTSVLLLSLLLMFTDLDALSSFTAILASINCMGTALGQVGPELNFSLLNDFQLAVCTFAMLLGRLEILSLLVLFTPVFWRK